MAELSAELYRKLVHGLLGLVVVLAPLVVSQTYTIISLCLFVIFLLIIKQTAWQYRVRQVRRRTWGEIAFGGGLLLSALFFYTHHTIAFQYGVLILALADAMAALVGLRWGIHRLGKLHKTWEGSAAFAVVTLCLTVICASLSGQTGAQLWLTSSLLTVLLTGLEASLGEGLDNLFIPIIASTLAVWMW